MLIPNLSRSEANAGSDLLDRAKGSHAWLRPAAVALTTVTGLARTLFLLGLGGASVATHNAHAGDPLRSIGIAIWGLALASLIASFVPRLRAASAHRWSNRLIGWFGRGEVRELDARILQNCAESVAMPVEIANRLGRALRAYAGIKQLTRDDAWRRSQVEVAEYALQAREQLLALLERGQQLTKVAAMLDRHRNESTLPPHLQEVAAAYGHHLTKLTEATEAFEQAEAGLSRALLALTAMPVMAAVPDHELRAMSAVFQSLANTLESFGETPTLPADRPKVALRGESDHGVGQQRL